MKGDKVNDRSGQGTMASRERVRGEPLRHIWDRTRNDFVRPTRTAISCLGFDTSVTVRSAPVASRLERRTSPEAGPPNPICLAGSVRVTLGVGDAVTISAGDAWLMEARPEAAKRRGSSRRDRSKR
jgi:hypothetical protein